MFALILPEVVMKVVFLLRGSPLMTVHYPNTIPAWFAVADAKKEFEKHMQVRSCDEVADRIVQG